MAAIVHNPEALAILRAEQLAEVWAQPAATHETEALRHRLSPWAQRPDTVFFVAAKAYFNQIRMSVALRRRGWTTVVIVLDAAMEAHNHGFFDAVVTTRLAVLLEWWSHSAGVLMHTQGWLFRYHVPVILEAYKPRSSRQVVEYMDLHRFMFPLDQLDTALPHMSAVWGEDCERNHRTQLACEQYIAERADALVFPGTWGAHRDAFGLGRARAQRAVTFLSYPLREFFAPPRRSSAAAASCPRLVFAGGVPTSSPRRPPAIFADAQLLSIVRQIAGFGFALDVYNNPLIAPVDAYAEHYPEHLSLAATFPNYRFLAGGMPWDIVQKLTEYDYGLMLYDCSGVVIGDDHFRHLVPTKFFLYLEAGLPVLVSRRWTAVVELVEEFGCGAVLDDDERGQLPRILARLDSARLRQQAFAAREGLAMDGQIERLIALYRAATPS